MMTREAANMETVLLLLADYANVSAEGKLNVMGVFDQLNATSFPTRHPEMHLVLRLRAELGEGGEARRLTIKLLSQDGPEVASLPPRDFSFPEPGEGRMPDMNFIIKLRDTVFTEPGRYEFVVMVDKEHKGSVPIQVNQIEPSGA